MTTPVWRSTRPVIYTCQASETGCHSEYCNQGRDCPDGPPMTMDDLLCAIGLVAVIAAPFVGVVVWRWFA